MAENNDANVSEVESFINAICLFYCAKNNQNLVFRSEISHLDLRIYYCNMQKYLLMNHWTHQKLD